VAGERVNVAIFAWDADGRVRGRVLTDWTRVRAMGTIEPAIVRKWAEVMAQGGPEVFDRAQKWTGSLEVSEVRASLRSAEEIIEAFRERVLVGASEVIGPDGPPAPGRDIGARAGHGSAEDDESSEGAGGHHGSSCTATPEAGR
jgi:hypothetical protein